MNNRVSRVGALVLVGSLLATGCSDDDSDDAATGESIVPATAAPSATGSDETTAPSGSAATSAPTTAPMSGEPGGSVVYGVEQEYTTYNNDNALDNLFANTEVLNLVQPSAFVTQPDLTVAKYDDLVESVEVTSTDPQVVVYSINPDAVWSDGEPIDCDDFYLDWLAGNGRAGYQVDETGTTVVGDDGQPLSLFASITTGFEDIESLECSDDGFTVTTTFTRPFVDYQTLFSNLLPAHVVERETGLADVTTVTDPADLQAIADFWNDGFRTFDPAIALSGSYYAIESVTPGETVVLVRNEAYWGEPGLVDEIVFRLIPSAPDLPAALANGDVSLIAPQPEPDLLAQLDGIDSAVTEVVPGTTFEHLDFNIDNPILADVNVRKAIATCIDRQEIVDTLVAPVEPDTEVLNNRFYVPFQADYADNGAGYETRDIDAAKALLEESGWTLGSDGVYEQDGERLSLRLGRRDPNPRRQKINELVAAQCREAGIELLDDASEDFNSTRLPRSDYDIALFAWVTSAFQSGNTSIYATGGEQNYSNYANPEVDELLAQADVEFDPAVRAELLNEADQLMWDDMATLPLFQLPNLVASSDAVAGVVPNDPLGPTWNGNEWSVVAS